MLASPARTWVHSPATTYAPRPTATATNPQRTGRLVSSRMASASQARPRPGGSLAWAPPAGPRWAGPRWPGPRGLGSGPVGQPGAAARGRSDIRHSLDVPPIPYPAIPIRLAIPGHGPARDTHHACSPVRHLRHLDAPEGRHDRRGPARTRSGRGRVQRAAGPGHRGQSGHAGPPLAGARPAGPARPALGDAGALPPAGCPSRTWCWSVPRAFRRPPGQAAVPPGTGGARPPCRRQRHRAGPAAGRRPAPGPAEPDRLRGAARPPTSWWWTPTSTWPRCRRGTGTGRS